ncbi:hypothetical protein BSL78_19146 [Apostichopus japonicus]|uniref:Uncharacterized protein n=1 Tax=Stichopus japonicus TaxID=307972 RepID=A0A2G8K7S4_STIJA|nr:hypothetical protein BSL78_19146 [Apostichopus japonicus]
MASSGGGKLKSKRTRGAKKPYQRPKSILSHMTEAVTGVVPTWMKSMFTKAEEERDSEVVSEPASPDFDPDAPSTSYGTGYPPVQRTHASR